jgi:hypothetical protein
MAADKICGQACGGSLRQLFAAIAAKSFDTLFEE